jgi:hypothetical protein
VVKKLRGDVCIETTDSKQPFLRLPIIGFVQNPDREVCCGKDKKVGEDEP